MAQQYASQQPAGYSNYIKNVALVGVGPRKSPQPMHHSRPSNH